MLCKIIINTQLLHIKKVDTLRDLEMCHMLGHFWFLKTRMESQGKITKNVLI